MTDDDPYARLIAEISQAGERWSAPLIASLRGRMLYLAIFKACLRVVHERGDRGSRFELREDVQSDQFELVAEPRRIRFERFAGYPVVAIHRDGFPPMLVPDGLQSESIEAPITLAEAETLARHQVNMALRLLVRRTD